MLAYVDENGNLTETPPDKNARPSQIIPPVVANSNALNAVDNTRKGIVTFFDPNKGYGFIKDSQTQESIFVHINSSSVQLKENLKVAFEMQKGPRGFAAANVQLSD
ncbi:cold-shock protein [Niabella ginsengisoli]|uniref:Cold shock domain-containing protein n=1 Tax=Niabella ginsengisoli TaxID=522298 RepID=A0ABS9SN31_9BACT|nr:cold shock domain-containing protein [Niabella ginsengisoli]MCH5599782.1 cold shock domain-containing protein [Niabella ginsengisoli]